MKILKAQFIKSTLDWQDGPDKQMPEIAVVGRSNVGKSSLINTLVNIHNFARVSKQPGKTRLINFFNINDLFYLVDLPGYGFAKVSKSEKRGWEKAIESYLLNREEMRCLFLLVDAKVGLKDNDYQMLEWLAYEDIAFRVIATKIDRINKSGRIKFMRGFQSEFPDLTRDLILFSSKTGAGKADLLTAIEKLL